MHQRANSADPDEVAHTEPPHLDLHCLQSSTICMFGTLRVTSKYQS